MKVKCEYCGSMIDDHAAFCPNCGAPNANMKRTAERTPKTIEELKAWYEARHLPPYETTRFFIGIDYKQPRAFGIYKEGNECIVYKNKDDGSRAIRYKGDDEAYAVNELYLKLKSEILNQKARNLKKGGGKRPGGSGKSSCTGTILKAFGVIVTGFLLCTAIYSNPLPALILAAAPVGLYFLLRYIFKKKGKDIGSPAKYGVFYIAFLLVMSLVVIGASPERSRAKYYSYDDRVYARYNGAMYIYDPYTYDYDPVDWYYVPDDLAVRPDDYEFDAENTEWDNSYKFEDSDYYEYNIEPEERSSDSGSSWDNDSDWDWDSGSDWDSGGSDWGSDW